MLLGTAVDPRGVAMDDWQLVAGALARAFLARAPLALTVLARDLAWRALALAFMVLDFLLWCETKWQSPGPASGRTNESIF